MSRRTAPLSLFVLTLGGAVAAIGCSGSSHHGGSITPNQPITMTIVPATGVPANGQTAALVNLSVHDPATGNPITSAVLTLTATGSGNIITQPAPTDQNGNTQGKIASTVAETKTVTAQGQTISAIATANVTFVQAGSASTSNEQLVLVSGDNQTAPSNGVLANPLIVKVTDASGNPVPGVPVLFTVTSGGGVLSITNTSTNQQGIAETTMRVGQPGDNTVTAVAKDESGNQIQGSPLVFHETAQ